LIQNARDDGLPSVPRSTIDARACATGPTLRQRLRDGPLPVEEALAVAACVLEALCHAHAAGVLHRDIKPENIIVTGPRAAKLLDFGIATLLFDAAAVATTAAAPGVSLAGTLGYMPPEQLRNQPVDARADVFQAAAVLYEMIAGGPAFPGETAAERLSAVLTRTPPPLELPLHLSGLNAVLARGLARDPAARYASAAAFLSDLRRASAGELSAGLPDSIAVLDFVNVGDTPDDEWIASGIAEAIGDALAQVPTLAVTPRDRVVRARAVRSDQPLLKAVPALGAALGCRWIVTGRYRRVGSSLSAFIVLIEVSTCAVAGRDRLDASLEQLFEVRDRAIAMVRNRLGVAAVVSGVMPAMLTAFECYARGRRLAVRNDRGAFDHARELFEAAIALDPNYAQAFAGLARICALTYTFTSDTDTLFRALEYARRALAIDPDLAEAEVWRGYANNRLGNFDAADQSLARCRSLNPREVYGFYFASAFRTARDPQRAIHLLQQSLALDPLFGSAWWGLGCLFIYLEHYDEAVSCFERCSRLSGVPSARPVPGIEGYWAEAAATDGTPW
jgi:TolB-like protein